MSKVESSFSAMVFNRAVKDTVHFFGYTIRDIVLGGVTLSLGALFAYVFIGKADTMREIVLIGAFTLAPAGIILCAIFLWHLWLAPVALAYDALREAHSQAVHVSTQKPQPKSKPSPSPVNWTIWRQRAKYSVAELAAILAKDDPVGMGMSHEQSAYLRLLIEELETERKAHARPSVLTPPVSRDTEIDRDAAIEWAKRKKFDVSHIE